LLSLPTRNHRLCKRHANAASHAEVPHLPIGEQRTLHTCGVRTNDQVACWGRNLFGEARPPAGTFRSVTVGVSYTCGVRTDARLTCWGRNNHGQIPFP